MSSVPRTTQEQERVSPVRRDTVVMGRADFFSVVLRLIGVELYKIRRRAMSRVLSAIAILVIIIGFIIVTLISFTAASSPVESFLPPRCSSTETNIGSSACLDHNPTAADMAKAEQARQGFVKDASESLRLPGSIAFTNQIMQFVGLVLIAILAGTIVGGEYSVGTIRLMFTRGPTRTQFLLSKIGAILICAALGLLGTIAIGVVSGALLNLFLGVSTSFSFFTGAWVLHLALYLLASIIGLFMYGMIALFLSTLGRATAAGVAGALVWWVLESIMGQVFSLVGGQIKGIVGDFLRAIPDYLIGSNVNALIQNQAQYVAGGSPSHLSDLHALLVLAAYLILFIGLAWWANETRDIAN